jgi:hypothetical protein
MTSNNGDVLFSDSNVLENQKGGKPSNVSVSVILKQGEDHRVTWKWEATVRVVRNERQFLHTDTISTNNPKKLVDNLFDMVCKELKTSYCGGCNVDCEPIIAFVEKTKIKCYEALKLSN